MRMLILSALLFFPAAGGDGKPLWDGKTLKGWHVIGKGDWTIEDGILVGRHDAKEGMFGHLVTDATYDDFVVRVTYKSLKGNSGSFPHRGERFQRRLGFQAEIDPKNDVGGLYETNGRGWVVQPKADEVKKFFKPGDWNTMDRFFAGPEASVEVNGLKTADINDPKGRLRGKIALQVHGGQEVLVMFKEVHIKGEPVGEVKQVY